MSFLTGKKLKIALISVVALVAIAGIAVGAYKGRTIEQAPSDVTATVSSQLNSKGADEGLTVVRTWSRKDCSLAPWLVTDKLGYFKEEGIQLRFTGELQPNQQVPSIINGNNDVASAHPNTVAVAVSGGAKLKYVSRGIIEPDESVDEKFRHMWFFVNPEKHPDIKSIADLKNLPGKIKFSIITINTCTDFLTNTLFDKYGISKDKIEWVTMPDVQAIQALKQGLVDVSPVHPPFYKGMEDAGARKIGDSFETGLGSLAGLTGYYFTDDYIAKNPDTVKRFVKAISKGQKYADENPEQVAQWVSEAIGIPVTGNHWYADDTVIYEDDLVPWLKQLEDNKVIPAGKVNPSDLVVHVFEQYGNE